MPQNWTLKVRVNLFPTQKCALELLSNALKKTKLIFYKVLFPNISQGSSNLIFSGQPNLEKYTTTALLKPFDTKLDSILAWKGFRGKKALTNWKVTTTFCIPWRKSWDNWPVLKNQASPSAGWAGLFLQPCLCSFRI